MTNSNHQKFLDQLINNVSNKYPFSIPCSIIKDNDNQLSVLQNNTSIIDKDVLGQIIYGLLKDKDLNDFIPIIISLKDNMINRMESKGVYILDSVNKKFIYLFGEKDHNVFLNEINELRSEKSNNTFLAIGYLCDSENFTLKQHEYIKKINKLLNLHGNIKGEYILSDYTGEIIFPLLPKNFKLCLLSWIIRNEGGSYDK